MYDFKSLSSHDFELLVRDLLQKHMRIHLESFKAGRDGGIDLRHAAAHDGTLVVQCKHYAETGYKGLLNVLNKEVLKVKKLSPTRYCVATSVPLSPDNKAEISAIFKPFCKGPDDIFGAEDINNFLVRFPEVERNHFKLWLTGSTVLDRFVHSGLYNQTVTLVETIQKKAMIYVQNASFFDAQDILKTHNYCIISGIPGIGKTFLAEMLLLQHISNGYEPVVIRHHIREAFDMLKASTKQVFYYDDFLGQTGWDDRLEKNEEQSILDFVRYVRLHEHAKFLLTTREYILQRARSVYEKLHAPEFDNAKCIVKLESYTRRNRAHILFNHVYFSALAPEYKGAISQRKPLLAIIDHDNYSPRIVEWMSDFAHVRDVPPTEYPQRFLATLDNPRELWLHAFRKHISPSSRSMLIVMASFRDAIELDDLREAVEEFRRREVERFGGTLGQAEVMTALEELEGSFVRCERSNQSVFVAFHNPSVRDFMEQHIADNAEIVYILCSGAVFYEQLMTVSATMPGKKEREQIALIAHRTPEVLAEAVLRTISRSPKQKRFIKAMAGNIICTSCVETTMEVKVAHALGLAEQLLEPHRCELSKKLIDAVTTRVSAGTAHLGDVHKAITSARSIDGVVFGTSALIAATAEAFHAAGQRYEDLDEILALHEFAVCAPEAMTSDLYARVKARLEEEGDIIFDCDIGEADDEHDIEHLRSLARGFEKTFAVDLSLIRERLDERLEEIKAFSYEPPDEWPDRKSDGGGDATDADIIAMFGALAE